MTKNFKKILIANRGEIAVRIARTCRNMGVIPISIYTTGEESLPHVTDISESCSLGDGDLADTYLNQDKIIQIAQSAGADAIHPGYGFLSENAEFCEKVAKSGIIFIGPSSKAIELMGDKIAARNCAIEISLPLIPGYHGKKQDLATISKEAGKIGYPVLIKAAAGGGGKGMRIVNNKKELAEGLKSASSEAKSAFGNGTIFVEKYITEPRHIEVQIFSDSHNNHIHLFERECSIQRRYQKIIEETPSTALDKRSRKEICKTAVKIAEYIDYTGAGTVEFIMDKSGKFYFLEMNTRLQVEHPITEMVTGLDLVELQIKVAQGEKLPVTQADLKQKGHAIEVRIYAEDPANNFLPTTGKIDLVGKPSLDGVRLDTGYSDNCNVSTSFDPMLAKLTAWGKTRDKAIEKLSHALGEVIFAGIKTNRAYLRKVLNSPAFAKGDTYTDFIDKNKELLKKKDLSNEEVARVVAGYFFAKSSHHHVNDDENISTWSNPKLSGFRVA